MYVPYASVKKRAEFVYRETRYGMLIDYGDKIRSMRGRCGGEASGRVVGRRTDGC